MGVVMSRERAQEACLLELQKPVVRSSIVVGKCSCRGGKRETGTFRPLAEDSYVGAKLDARLDGVRHSKRRSVRGAGRQRRKTDMRLWG